MIIISEVADLTDPINVNYHRIIVHPIDEIRHRSSQISIEYTVQHICIRRRVLDEWHVLVHRAKPAVYYL